MRRLLGGLGIVEIVVSLVVLVLVIAAIGRVLEL